MTNSFDFTFSDLVSGYVTSYHPDEKRIELETSDGRNYSLTLNDNSYAKLSQNLGESWQDRTSLFAERLKPGQMIFAYGTYFPEQEIKFEVNYITFPGDSAQSYLHRDKGCGSNKLIRLQIAI